MIVRMMILAGLALVLAGCASSKPSLDSKDARRDVSPETVSQNLETVVDDRVMWAGVIVDATNLQSHTQLEVLSYPLNRQSRPDLSAKPTGRFLVRHDGYLETLDYAPGRSVTVVGRVGRLATQKIGDAEYAFPVLMDEQLRLWRETDQQSEPRVNFGFGFIFRN